MKLANLLDEQQEFKARIKDMMSESDRQFITGLAQLARKLDVSSNLNEAADMVQGNQKFGPESADWAIDTLTVFFAPIIRDWGKKLKRKTKDEFHFTVGTGPYR